MARKLQALDQVIDVSGWVSEDNGSPYPEGARAKIAYICSKSVVEEYSFLIPNHRYLFKESNPRYPEQYWVEITACIVGEYMGVAVPPAFVSYDSMNNKCGALIEWFYGRPDKDPYSRYTMGGDFMTRMIRHYDRGKGKQHNFRTIEALSRSLSRVCALKDDFVCYWERIFLFDALIGNTDRHQDNWGVIWYNREGYPDRPVAKFSPAFDNGTAMGHEILKAHIQGRSATEAEATSSGVL